MIEYDKFQKSLKHLQQQYENYINLPTNIGVLMRDGIAESVVQRFETCWDCLWKVLRRYLIEEVGLADVPHGPNPVLRLAAENNLLTSPIERWIEYNSARVDTAHDYSGEKANHCLELMADFIKDAIVLYKTLSKKDWL